MLRNKNSSLVSLAGASSSCPSLAHSFTSLGEEQQQREARGGSPSKDPSVDQLDLGLLNPVMDNARRRIHFGAAVAGSTVQGRGGTNAVSTTKYEMWNMVPKNLFEQFQRAANIWFLIVSVCQMLPLELSPTSKYATIVPLASVLFVTFCKDAYEDYVRRWDDSCVNNQRCSVVDPTAVFTNKLRETSWKDVMVGTYLQLERDEPVPADMVLIACSNEDGVAYVDTAQLDGETSLKPKFVLEETMRIGNSKELMALEGHLDAEMPNQLVQSFHGTLHLRGFPRGVPVDAKNFLLRGSTLRNTAWVYGLVVYTGYDTKLVQNLKKTPSKRSRVEVTANYLLIIVFAVLCCCALFAAAMRAILQRDGSDESKKMSWVWPEQDPLRDNQYLAFITFMIGYNNLIPISLYVTSDLVRSFQAFIMERDRSMFSPETDSGCRVRNSNLNDNLGQVEFVLTDKTGTLTENHMQFKACSVQGKFYGCWHEEVGPKDEVVDLPPNCRPLSGAARQFAAAEGGEGDSAGKKGGGGGEGTSSKKGGVGTSSSDFARAIDPEEEALLDHFFLCLATCHTAIVEKSQSPKRGEGSKVDKQRKSSHSSSKSSEPFRIIPPPKPVEEPPKPQTPPAVATAEAERGEPWENVAREAEASLFRSPSPDEEALLSAARDYGFFLRKKCHSRLTVNVRGKDLYYNVLLCNEFSSDRKRMSVLVRRTDDVPGSESNTRHSTINSVSVDSSYLSYKRSSTTGLGWPLDALPEQPEGSQPTAFRNTSTGSSVIGGGCPSVTGGNKYPAVLYAKGADNVMLERISKQDTQGLATAKRHLQQFSKEGLRTLLCAKRELTDNQADHYCWKMQEAKTAFMNRNIMVEKVADDMERELEILGVTAIEDRIQKGVPDTVNMLLRAGVKVWMLTGDNMETSLNVGVACRLVDPGMTKYKLEPGAGGLNDVEPSSVLQHLGDFYNHISRQMKAERRPGDFKYCLALHGKVLYTILDGAQATLRQLFLQIACSSSSVIACRLAPAQKAALVKLVRNCVVGSPLTLAIGDGGNDVSMIQEAHVGVGLLGVEGRQAANAADYVISQFRFLQPLLFVHGRWNLRRIGIVIGYSFYKNFLLVFPLVHFGRYSGFTGTTLYESYLLSTFNLVFTSLPIMTVGVLDMDVTDSMALLVPSLYQLGIQRRYFNAQMLLGWMLRGLVHAELTFLIMIACFSGSMATSEDVPNVPDYLAMGSWAYWACVAVANLVLLLHAKAWMDWQVIMVFGSILIVFPCLALYSDGSFVLASTFEANMVGVAGVLFGQWRSWLGLVLVASTCGLGELAVSFAKRELYPDAADILQEIQQGCVAGGAECPESSTREERRAFALEYLKKLPPPPEKVMRPKPEGRVSLKPFPAHASQRRRRKWPRGPQVAPVEKDVFSIVPVNSDMSDPKERPAHLEDPPSAIIAVPDSFRERLWRLLRDTASRLWWVQWTEMTVGELCNTLEYDQVQISSNYFKSAICNSTMQLRGEKLAEEPGSPMAIVAERTHSFQEKGWKETRETSLQIDSAPSPRSQFTMEPSDNTSTVSKEVIKDLMYSVVSLRFWSASQEDNFGKFLSRQAVQLFRKSLMALFGVLFLYNLFELTARPSSGTAVRIAICVGVVPCCAVTHYVLRTGCFKRHAEPLVTTFVIALIVAKHVYDLLTRSQGILVNSYLPLFIFAGTRIRFTFVGLVLLFHMLAILLRYWLLSDTLAIQSSVATIHEGWAPSEQYLVLMLGITTLATYYCYQLEKLMRKDYFVLESIWRSRHQAMEILKGMFPEEVVEHVLAQIGQDRRNAKGGEGRCSGRSPARALREDRGIVTVLFCDICDFDGLVEMLLPGELVKLLDLMWMMFDRICDLHGVVKVETVSKTYMAAAMPEEPHQKDTSTATAKRHAADALNAVLTAIGMLELVCKRFTGTGKVTKVSVRIGAHTGPALSGVVGSQKPQFALFGDTVNTAARMQSTGKRNGLHISGATHELVAGDGRFEWEARQTQVKGKGNMTTYLLKRYRLESRRLPGVGISAANSSEPKPPPRCSRPQAIPPLAAPDFLPGAPESVSRLSENSEEVPTPHSHSGDSSMRLETMSAPLPNPHAAGTFERIEQRGKAMAYFRHQPLQGSKGTWKNSRVGGWRCSCSYLLRRLCRFWGEVTWFEHDAQRLRGSPMFSQWVSFFSFLVTYWIESIALRHATQEDSLIIDVLRWGYLVFSVLVAWLLYRVGKRYKWGTKRTENLPVQIYSDVMALSIFLGFACSFATNILSTAADGPEEMQDGSNGSKDFWTVFEGFFFVMVLLHFCRLHPQGFVPVLLCVMVIAAITTWVGMRDTELLLECCAYTVFVVVTHLIAVVGDPRWNYSDQKAICEDHERVSELLDSLLPREVLQEMKSGSLSLAYQYEDMTLLFADIVGFTRYCADHTAEQAVNLVTQLFAEFDEQAVQLGVYKVCTIGDAYVAVNEPRQNVVDKFGDCESVFTMGKCMLKCIARVRVEVKHHGLDMRIGLHSGQFVGGVIGTKRLRFDIWGEDVLIGNNVESHGCAGCICVSEATKEVLEHTSLMPLSFAPNNGIELKNGRMVRTYVCKSPQEQQEGLDSKPLSAT